MRTKQKPSVEEAREGSGLLALTRVALDPHDAVIREQFETIAELKSRLERFEIAFENSPLGVAFFDRAGRLIKHNRRYAEIYAPSPAADFAPATAANENADAAAVAAIGLAPQAASAGSGQNVGVARSGVWTSSLADGRRIEVRRQPVPDGGWMETHTDVTDLLNGQKLVAERMSLHALIDLVPDNLWVKDAESRFLIANNATALRMGLAGGKDLIGRTDLELCPAETAQTYYSDERRVVATGRAMIEKEEYVLTPDGRKTWILTSKVPMRDETGQTVGLVGISHDITTRKLADALRDGQSEILEMIVMGDPLEQVLTRLARLIESQMTGIFVSVLVMDEDGSCLRHGAAPSLPEAYRKLLDGISIGPNAGSCGSAAFTRAPVIVADVMTDPHWAEARDVPAAFGLRSCWSTPICSKQGQVLGTFALYSLTVREPTGEERPLIDVATRIAGIAIERKLTEDRIQFMATHDALTSLPNRGLLKDRLDQAIRFAERYDRWATVAFVDLDNFKLINDSLGHSAGDELLKVVASRMLANVGRTDTVVRIGGDEFVIVLCDQNKDIEGLATTLQRVQNAVAEPILLEGHTLRVTSSLGVATFPNDGQDSETLLSNADSAMYRAKEVGRDNLQFYRPEINIKVHEKFRMQEELRLALQRNEFVLHYQPQANLRTNSIFAAEALIRWNHPLQGMLAPMRFIPLAEEIGLIVPIGEWVLKEACRQAKAWQNDGLQPIRVSVNVSARQFQERKLTSAVVDALRESGLEARYLELELTESLIMQDVTQAVKIMEELEALGVQLSIDDFGTGYSSLNALKTFPVARLKIDRTFIKGLPSDTDDMAVATAVISLGQKLNLEVIAEGVETAEQLAFLRANNCDEIQGYHLSRPIPPQEFQTFLRDWVAVKLDQLV